MTERSARSRRPARVPVSMCSRSFLASAGERTGVAPLVTTCFGPRTAAAGFTGRTWLTTSPSQSMRMAARCCFTVGADPGVGPDVGRDVERRDRFEPEASGFAPPEKLPHRPRVRRPRPRVRDPPREELQIPLHRRRTGVDDHPRQNQRGRARARHARHRLLDRDRVVRRRLDHRHQGFRHSFTTSPPPSTSSSNRSSSLISAWASA